MAAVEQCIFHGLRVEDFHGVFPFWALLERLEGKANPPGNDVDHEVSPPPPPAMITTTHHPPHTNPPPPPPPRRDLRQPSGRGGGRAAAANASGACTGLGAADAQRQGARPFSRRAPGAQPLRTGVLEGPRPHALRRVQVGPRTQAYAYARDRVLLPPPASRHPPPTYHLPPTTSQPPNLPTS